MLEVVCVWAPREREPMWPTYLRLLGYQRNQAEALGHRHLVVAEGPVQGFETLQAELPKPLMHAILAGQLAYLEQWSDAHPVVLLDADCMITRNLEQAFDGSFDIGLTHRDNPEMPIQNGAMYFDRGSRAAALQLFRRALAICKKPWGGDQAAIGEAVAPVPREDRVEQRYGARVAFLSCDPYNFSPKDGLPKNLPKRFVVHFKGKTKHLALPFLQRHNLLPVRCVA